MSMLKTGLGALSVAALVLTATNPAGAAPAGKSTPQAPMASKQSGDLTDFSAQRRHRRGGGHGGAAAAAAFAGIVGTAIAASAARNYYDDGYYGRGPGYYRSYNYYGGPGYYNNGPSYGGYNNPNRW